jgi:murein DD-endopeptidase MepM/ murein hydrolase activator NlpD
MLQFGPATVEGGRLTGLPLSGPLTALFGSTSIAEHAAGHSGVDVGVPVGTLVRAPAAGQVTAAVAGGGVFGTYVEVRHAGGWLSLYAHLSALQVQAGQRVATGDLLGLSGNTGLSTGPHLHWGLGYGASPLVRGPHLRDPLASLAAAPVAGDRARTLRGCAWGLAGALQAAGALFGTEAEADFAGYPADSDEQLILAIQRAANPFLGRHLSGS